MRRHPFLHQLRLLALAWLPGVGLACVPDSAAPPPDPTVYEGRESPGRSSADPYPDLETPPHDDGRFTGVSKEDRRFAEFLRTNSGGMIKQASVNAQAKGLIRIELDSKVSPEDTLPLSKSVVTGARKDFPNQPLIVAVYDPGGEPIFRAIYRPDQGIKYEMAQDRTRQSPQDAGRDTRASREDARDRRPRQPRLDEEAESSVASDNAQGRGGVTEADRKFARWAEERGKSFLRYVEADLERNGRLWFGVTRETKPADVPELTRSLLKGAQTEFPKRNLIATVFDPDGERIGRARLGSDGTLDWER